MRVFNRCRCTSERTLRRRCHLATDRGVADTKMPGDLGERVSLPARLPDVLGAGFRSRPEDVAERGLLWLLAGRHPALRDPVAIQLACCAQLRVEEVEDAPDCEEPRPPRQAEGRRVARPSVVLCA